MSRGSGGSAWREVVRHAPVWCGVDAYRPSAALLGYDAVCGFARRRCGGGGARRGVGAAYSLDEHIGGLRRGLRSPSSSPCH